MTLGDELPKEVARVSAMIPVYLSCGSGGAFAVSMMRADLDTARAAMVKGDAIEMLRIYQKLKGWEL